MTILCITQYRLKFTNRVFQIKLYENKRKQNGYNFLNNISKIKLSPNNFSIKLFCFYLKNTLQP